MAVTMLYSIAGKPGVSDISNPFTDVAAERWYTDAVKWAASNAVVAGTGNNTFTPDAPITRQDLALILYR